MNERDIFLSACEIEDGPARREFLIEACAGDLRLRQRIKTLLAAQSNIGDFLETPVVVQLGDANLGTIENQRVLAKDLNASIEISTKIAMTSTGGYERNSEIPLTFLEPSTEPGSLGRLGNYEVLEVVGSGAFGIVLKASDRDLNRVVAVKVLSPDFAATSPARKRFLREARAAAAIRHDNVVHIYAVHEQPIAHLAMEFIAGRTIQQRIDEQGALDVIDVVRLGRQIARGLAAAHENGLIHRDIKPSNLMLENENIKITDFGLARSVDDASVTQSGLIAGTPMYMSPEQSVGTRIDHRTDLFSLGSVLYVMACGIPPFRASTTVGVLKRVAEDTPRSLKEILSCVPDWLCGIISKLHEKRPEDRFASAAEVADLLNRCLIEVERGCVPSVHVYKPSGNRMTSVFRRHPTVTTFSLVAILSAVFAILYWNGGWINRLQDRHANRGRQAKSSVGKPVDLGSRFTRSGIADGHLDDVKFSGEVLSFDATTRSPNIWVNFVDVEGDELTIQTRFRVLNPESPGSLKLIFMTHRGAETFGLVAYHGGQRFAKISEWINYTPARETRTEILPIDWGKWTDLRFVVTHDRFTLSIDNQIVAELERTEQHAGFVSICCREWKCEMRRPNVVIDVFTESVLPPE